MITLQRFNFLNLIAKARFSTECNDVLINQTNHCGIITLNRPEALNSLNKNMVDIIYKVLTSWSSDRNVSHVIIEGAGEKAFCAGGDIRRLTNEGKSNVESATSFFRNAFTLNHLIGSFNKPYIALIDGITMGGGFGLSVHGKYRIATQKTVFAMPETVIGLFPDVGCGYILPRLQGNLGIYLGLLGARLKGEDVVIAGVATHFVDSQKIKSLKEELTFVNTDKEIQDILENYSNPVNKKNFSLASQMPWIDEHFAKPSVELVLASLSQRVESTNCETERAWSRQQIDRMSKLSPVSLKISLRQLNQGRTMTFHETFTMEYRMVKRCMENHDFYEGVRALLIDRDNKPKWNPASLEEVTNEMVDEYFRPVNDDLLLGN